VIAICLAGATVFSSCDKKHDNFYNLEYRTGLWVNKDRKDTLEFVNSSKLIRKGLVYEHEEYLYRIENNALYISLPDNEYNTETYHPILKVEKDNVTIGNIYATFGFDDNSGIFRKVL
jgi:hypothetical protein